MNPLSLQQICQTTHGQTIAAAISPHSNVTSISTDTRSLQPGSLYVPIRGERFDGHAFLPDAAAKGAIAALVEGAPATPPPNLHLIRVADTRIAFGRLATHVRQEMKSTVIGVAGSNGKTSTKKLIDAALHGKLRGSISPKSFNNDIGVPITIFAADPMDDYLVLEMGTNHPGEIRRLAEMARPDIAVITNCGAEHLEGLVDLAGVRKENASILAGLDPNGMLIVNGDDADLLEAVGGYRGQRVTFGFEPTNDLFATKIECTSSGTRFCLNFSDTPVFLPLLGRHNAANALAAIAVGRRLGVTDEAIIASLAEAAAADMRLQLSHTHGVTLLNDAYNANPSSMRAGLQTLVDLPSPGRRVAVLGDMLELGDSSDQYHREIGQIAADAKLDLLICVGERAALSAAAAKLAGLAKEKIRRYTTAASAAKLVPKLLRPGDLVLLKASRSIRLEQVAKAIESAKPASQKAAS